MLTVFPITADLRNRKRLMKRVRESEQRLELLLENSTDAVFHLRTSGHVLYASPSVERLSGFSVSDFNHDSVLRLVEPEWQVHVQKCHAEVLSSAGKTVRYEFLARNKEGEKRWYETLSRAICNSRGEVESVVSIVRDTDARKREELGLIKEARIDGLTGLLNRRGFESKFEGLKSGDNVSLAVLDIDHFKTINDLYGHPAGDRALQTFADIALRSVRKDDCLARIGGEEFAILLCGMSDEAAQNACERLRSEIANSLTFYGAKEIRFTVSIGLTRVRSSSLDEEIARADAALYEAKRGDAIVCVLQPSYFYRPCGSRISAANSAKERNYSFIARSSFLQNNAAMKTALLTPLLALFAGCATIPNGPICRRRPDPHGRLGNDRSADPGRRPRRHPKRVVEDSRCPINARCVWAGRLILSTRIDGAGWRETANLTLGQTYRTHDRGIRLVSAEPGKLAGSQPPVQATTFGFELAN